MKLTVLLCLLVLPVSLFAESGVKAEEEFFELERATLEEVLNTKTTVSTLNTLSLRETPGLVTVITAEEIRSSGARDLVDVLNMLPEFEFGMDSWGNIGLGVRGNWANEGKILLLWDGQVYNDPLYTNVQFDRFPIDQIESIEIVKGPGSVIYGGFSELAVINVKTRSAKNLKGSELYAAYGQARSRARDYAGYSFAKVLDSGYEVSASAFVGEAQRSDRRYKDFYGNSYNMNGASSLRGKNLNLYAAGRGLHLRFIADGYSLWQADQYGEIISTGIGNVGFSSTFAEAKYEWRVNEKLRIEPRVNFAQSKPWFEDNPYDYFDKKVEHYTGALTAFYDHTSETSVVAGGEWNRDAVRVGLKTDPGYWYADGKMNKHYDSFAVFGQGMTSLARINIIAGGRYDKHSSYGSSFVPRLAATKLWDRFSFKAIYSGSFRAPSIENVRVNPDIKPERTSSVEAEVGYKAGNNLFLSGNVFQVEIHDPILYYIDAVGETYTNYERCGTNGFGLGAKFKQGALRADLNYLSYAARGNRVDAYNVPGHGSYMLGFPKHKITALASVPVGEGVSVNPSAVYVSRRYGYAGSGSVEAFGDLVMANLNLQIRNKPLKNLTFSLGIRDMFNSGYSYIQPYAGGHAPMPTQSREFFLKTAYEF